MNNKQSDSARLPLALPVAGWGHALATVRAEPDARQSLPDILAALPANACHEVFATLKGDRAPMAGFAMMLALMLAGDAPCFFVHVAGHNGMMLYPAGLAELGLDPARCFSVHAPDLLSALRATADIARSGAAGTVLVEVEGNPRLLDLTASRRLALAAEKSGTMVLLLRSAAHAAPSAAYSRWQIAPAPSQPLLANAPGAPAFNVTLLRHRRVQAGQAARLIWNFEDQCFDAQDTITAPQRSGGEAASGRASALVAGRAAAPHGQPRSSRAA
jgi:protein ImuA